MSEFFHVTSYWAVPNIAELGLLPRRGAGLYQHGGYGEHSQGKIFLAHGKNAALAWFRKIADMLEYYHGDDNDPQSVVPVLLRALIDHDWPERDPLGDRDVPGSYFVTDAIEPEFLEYWNPDEGAWVPLSRWDEAPPADAGGDRDGEAFLLFGPYDPGGFKPDPSDERAWSDAES